MGNFKNHPSYIVPKNYILRIMRKMIGKYGHIYIPIIKQLIYVFTTSEEETTIYG